MTQAILIGAGLALLTGTFPTALLPPGGWLAFARFTGAVVGAFVINYAFNFGLGCLEFWFGQTGNLFYAKTMAMNLAVGAYFPLEALPPAWQAVAYATPFPYLAAWPARVYLGQVSAAEWSAAMAQEAAWIAGLALLAAVAWRCGLRRYGAQGG